MICKIFLDFRQVIAHLWSITKRIYFPQTSVWVKFLSNASVSANRFVISLGFFKYSFKVSRIKSLSISGADAIPDDLLRGYRSKCLLKM